MGASGIEKIGVIGIGLMGSGIAQVSATYGFDTVVADMSDEVVKRGMARIEDSLSKLVASYERSKGQRGMAPEQRDATLAKLRGTSNLQELLDCDLIIEAVTENYAVKAALYEQLVHLGYRICWPRIPHRSPSPIWPRIIPSPRNSWACTS